MEVPSLNEAVFISLEKKILTEWQATQGSSPFTNELIKAMETYVIEAAFDAAKVFLWWHQACS